VHLRQRLDQIGVAELLFIREPVVYLVKQVTGPACQPQLANELAYLHDRRGVQQ
jgi:hypothetical protein